MNCVRFSFVAFLGAENGPLGRYLGRLCVLEQCDGVRITFTVLLDLVDTDLSGVLFGHNTRGIIMAIRYGRAF